MQKIFLDLTIQNTTQERDLFKHLALLSSAILGIFAFTGDRDINCYLLFGLIGLFLVIIISFLLLFIIIKVERGLLKKAKNIVLKTKEEQSKFWVNFIIKNLNSQNLTSLKSLFKDDEINDEKVIEGVALIKSSFDQHKASLDKITEEDNNNLKKEEKCYNNIFNISSIVCVFVFIISMFLIGIGSFFI